MSIEVETFDSHYLGEVDGAISCAGENARRAREEDLASMVENLAGPWNNVVVG